MRAHEKLTLAPNLTVTHSVATGSDNTLGND